MAWAAEVSHSGRRDHRRGWSRGPPGGARSAEQSSGRIDAAWGDRLVMWCTAVRGDPLFPTLTYSPPGRRTAREMAEVVTPSCRATSANESPSVVTSSVCSVAPESPNSTWTRPAACRRSDLYSAPGGPGRRRLDDDRPALARYPRQGSVCGPGVATGGP